MQLYRAPWVVPVASSPVQDGAVCVRDGRIVAVDRFSVLKGMAPVVDCEDVILTPALINAHCHLELSSLAELGLKRNRAGDITSWITELLSLRAEKKDADALREARAVLHSLYDSGIAAVADVGNSIQSAEIGGNSPVQVLFLLELLGLAKAGVQAALERCSEACCRDNHGNALGCTAHAPYSAGPELLTTLKNGAKNGNRLFSIHAAESSAEIEFLATGKGDFRDFVERRGAWDGTFVPPECGAITYLHRLGIIDNRTLCVHCVHVSEDEIRLLAESKGKICLCPGSNRNLGVGVAPVPEILLRGILPAIGTDSLASNHVLNIWEEMRVLREDHPGLDPETVFMMATLGGAEAIGCPGRGTLAPGKLADMLAVNYTAGSRQDVMEFLTSKGLGIEVRWIG